MGTGAGVAGTVLGGCNGTLGGDEVIFVTEFVVRVESFPFLKKRKRKILKKQ